MLDSFMQQLVKELEIEESLATEVPGVYHFPVDEEVTILITEIPRGFEFTCSICPCPEKGLEEFFTHALFANLFAQGTEGCVLGLDAEGEFVTLSRTVDYEISFQEFKDMLEDFVNSVSFWKEETLSYTT
jgi:hypothetical protein